ncbi:MAG TPA: lipid-A-disaccharide synthase [Gammaproteobacteria bacterium]|nr:lipid-A-disaccharide synthase [Gammaproteobacteria bacterium]
MQGTHPLHVGIVAGEASGDNLGAGLIEAIRAQVPDAVFEGIGGPRMIQAGCYSLYPIERLSVMGLVEVVRHLPDLLSIRRDLKRHFQVTPPDIFIGIDAPDFNLTLEKRLKRFGIRTVHYVSPSVWAWRSYRIRKIAASVDCMLTLFPFEEAFYRERQVSARCVGHPMADLIADDVDRGEARRHLGIRHRGPLVAILPGSRVNEVRRMAAPFLQAAAWCYEQRIDMHYVVPLANQACRDAFEAQLAKTAARLPVTLLDGDSLGAMAAADAVMLASGTATLECMLLKRPMVVAYRLSPLTYRMARLLVNTRHFSLPNLLAGRPLVRELIQDEVTAENLGREILALIQNPVRAQEIAGVFAQIHQDLRRDASRQAADIVLEMSGWRETHAR